MPRCFPPLKRLLLLFLMALLSSCSQPEFTDSTGKGVSLSDSQGRWLALNIWAEWCDPCREEIPELNALYQSDAIRVLGYDFDNSQGAELESKIASLAIAFPVLTNNPLERLKTRTPQVLPATLIVSPQGDLVETLYGPQTQNTIGQAIRKQQTKVAAGG
ncbi:TlpA family protein disulfide reductase [Endozoicomonas euniceicola]|uniref:TlpA family protein disulfide reductase n=1 Tax=Endozoicomonas euniceicola TaxID=1234143 RepID=A0ABY6GXP4_9GAMM|nr:TlpA disulfide reductase family protein [Endozoicomonas euniceicola]UYM16826.1 TlpA family protein disulfide reductase [Endozoicomonas euniceicola]